METIGDRILKIRKELNLTQRELCKMADITEVSLSRYENGTRIPHVKVLGRLAKILGVSTDYLIGIPKVKYHQIDTFSQKSTEAEYIYYFAEKYLKRDGVMYLGKPITEKAINRVLKCIEFGISLTEEDEK